MSSSSLRFGVQQILDEGSEIQFSERMKDLCLPGDETAAYERDLEKHFDSPIEGQVFAFRVGTKVHVKGYFETQFHGECDRCGSEATEKIKSDWEIFLMPADAFSESDSDGGKFRHGEPGEDDHDDLDFGEFDGTTVDLRPFLREEVVLQSPMKILCQMDCKGLCLSCGRNLNVEPCKAGCTGERVQIETDEDRLKSHDQKSKMAEAFAKRGKKSH